MSPQRTSSAGSSTPPSSPFPPPGLTSETLALRRRVISQSSSKSLPPLPELSNTSHSQSSTRLPTPTFENASILAHNPSNRSRVSFKFRGLSFLTAPPPSLKLGSFESTRKLASKNVSFITKPFIPDKIPLLFPFRSGKVYSQQLANVWLERRTNIEWHRYEKWTSYKYFLLFSVLSVLAYGVAGLLFGVFAWLSVWESGAIMVITTPSILIFAITTCTIIVFTSLVGLSGLMLNSRPILAMYTLLLWPTLVMITIVGYQSYLRVTSPLALDRQITHDWSGLYTSHDKLTVQLALRCCGFHDPTDQAVYYIRGLHPCYEHSQLPGCKGPLWRFERNNLAKVYTAAFSCVLLHFVNIVIALLCANHVSNRFGIGIMPKQYWVSQAKVKASTICRPQEVKVSSVGVFRTDKDRENPMAQKRHG